MIKLITTVCIDAPAERVWEHLARIEDVPRWADLVLRAQVVGPITRGVGAERVCELAGGRTIRERWTDWEEGRSFTYEGFDLPMMRHASNRWSVRAHGERSTLTSEATLVLRWGAAGALLEPILAPMMRRAAAQTLAAFTYLVERGEPFRGRAAELPRAPSACV